MSPYLFIKSGSLFAFYVQNHGEESEDSSDEEINGEDEMIGPEVMNGSTNGLTNGYGSSSEMDED